MEDLVAIALMYSYIVNGVRELPDYTISTYIDEVKRELIKLRSKYDINERRTREFFDSVPYKINVRNGEEIKAWNPSDKNSNPCANGYANQPILYYGFASLEDDLLRWFSRLDQDLVSATLAETALEHLSIRREDLPIKTSTLSRTGEMSIYSLVEKEAREKALRYLEEDGFTNVNIGGGIPIQSGDKAYQYYFSATKEMSLLDYYDKNIYEKLADLRTRLIIEDYKSEVLNRADADGKVNLKDLYLAKTALLDKDNNTVSHAYLAVVKLTGDEDAFYNRVVASRQTGSSDVTVFIDLLEDEVMNFFWQGRFGDKKFERVVEDIILLSNSMNMESATLEEISNHVDELNKKPVMKELKPQ